MTLATGTPVGTRLRVPAGHGSVRHPAPARRSSASVLSIAYGSSAAPSTVACGGQLTAKRATSCQFVRPLSGQVGRWPCSEVAHETEGSRRVAEPARC
uniref:Orf41 n=1 Tax=Saccharopolyspora spinosa TaxID=60894 RepID=Q6JHM6_SACSN|nr:Orf41 [Saccharopolyspora spinosa NRRL 18395]